MAYKNKEKQRESNRKAAQKRRDKQKGMTQGMTDAGYDAQGMTAQPSGDFGQIITIPDVMELSAEQAFNILLGRGLPLNQLLQQLNRLIRINLLFYLPHGYS